MPLCWDYGAQPLHQLGQVFWRGVSWLLKPGSTYEDAGRFVIDRYVLVHVKDWASKFETLLLMFRKLRQLRARKIPVGGGGLAALGGCCI